MKGPILPVYLNKHAYLAGNLAWFRIFEVNITFKKIWITHADAYIFKFDKYMKKIYIVKLCSEQMRCFKKMASFGQSHMCDQDVTLPRIVPTQNDGSAARLTALSRAGGNTSCDLTRLVYYKPTP